MNRTHRGSLSSTEAKRGYTREQLIAKGVRDTPALDRILARWGGVLPVIAGGVTTYGDAITNPLTAPTVGGTQVTVDVLLQNPTVITREIADRVMANFFLDKVFRTGGSVQGGAVLYTQANVIDVYTDRDVERIQPGAEFPIVTGARTGPLVQPVEKFGGKFPVTDEAKERNDAGRVQNEMRRLSNTMVRKMQQRALAELQAAITAFSRTEASTVTWLKSAEEAQLNRVALNSPVAVIFKAIAAMEGLEMSYTFDTLIVNPLDLLNLNIFFGSAGALNSAMADAGITTIIKTPRKAVKSAYLVDGTMLGEMRLERAMRTTVEREGAPLMREQTWIQSGVNPVFVVTDPYAAMEITNLS